MRRLTALLITGLLGSFISAATATIQTDDAGNTGFLGKGRYRIQSVTSGHFLELYRTDKKTLQQWSNSGALNQQWDVEDAGGGYFYLRSAETRKALEAINKRDGSSVLAKREPSGRAEQKWRIVDLGNGESLIITRSGKVLDIADNSRNEGARVQIWGEHRGANQRFKFDRTLTSDHHSDGRARDKNEQPSRGAAETSAP